MTGWVSVHGRRTQFESALERDFLILLDSDPTVAGIVEQPLKIAYTDFSNLRRSYTPDVLVTYRDKIPELCEVKYRADIKQDWKALKPKFRAGRRFAQERGWKFRIMTEAEIRTVFLSNLGFLRSYRAASCETYTCQHLLDVAGLLGTTTPEALLAAAYWIVEDRHEAVASIWRLIANNFLNVDLSRPLTMASAIRLTRREERL